jgi:hypothetical protein
MTPDDTLNLLIAFADASTINSTQWRDPDGIRHTCFDMGAVHEFFYDLKQYVISVGGMEEFARLWRETR